MIDDDVTAILNKTRDYYDFIKSRLESESVQLKAKDLEELDTINSYLTIVSEDINNWGRVKSDVHKNVLGTCIAFLQRLDRLTKEYKLFQNGSKNELSGDKEIS